MRAKPPIPALEGSWAAHGGQQRDLAGLGAVDHGGARPRIRAWHRRSKGTILIQIAGNVRHGGLYEAAFGMSLGQIVNEISAAAPPAAARSRRCRWAAPWAPISRPAISTPFGYEELAGATGFGSCWHHRL